MTVEGVLLEHYLLGTILADDEEWRVATKSISSNGGDICQLHGGFAHIHTDLVLVFHYKWNRKSKLVLSL